MQFPAPAIAWSSWTPETVTPVSYPHINWESTKQGKPIWRVSSPPGLYVARISLQLTPTHVPYIQPSLDVTACSPLLKPDSSYLLFKWNLLIHLNECSHRIAYFSFTVCVCVHTSHACMCEGPRLSSSIFLYKCPGLFPKTGSLFEPEVRWQAGR